MSRAWIQTGNYGGERVDAAGYYLPLAVVAIAAIFVAVALGFRGGALPRRVG